MKLSAKRALLFIPILVLGGLSLLHEYRRSTGTVWTVPITGYDPRDMLRGHYLQYRYEWNLADADTLACRGADCALCTDEPERFDPPVRLIHRDEAAACASYIAVSADSFDSTGIFIADAADNLTRYYVPETEALRLQALLTQTGADAPEFTIGLRVTDSGTAYIEAMYVDGTPLEEWLRQ